MKVVILCGGRGMRLNEFTETIPKSLVKVHNKPILWYICNHFKKHGNNDFIFCLGYKGELIKEEFTKYPEFNVEYINTGVETSKTGRLSKIRRHIDDENFFLSYGDDITDANLNDIEETHKENNAIVTLLAVPLKSEFGIVQSVNNGQVIRFAEKPSLPYYINGGYYMCSNKVFPMIDTYGDFETIVLPKLAEEKRLYSLQHDGYWKSVNTLKDVVELNDERKLLEQ